MRKAILLFLIYFLSTSVSWAQNEFLIQLKKGQFKSVEKKIEKTLRKNPEDINANYIKANLLIQKKYERYNPDSAYRYIQITKQLLDSKSDKKELAELRKIKISKSTVKSTLSNVYRLAMDSAVNANTEDAFTHFLSYYPEAEQSYKLRAQDKLDMLAYEKIKDSNCPPCYQQFIAQHSPSKATTLAQEKIHELEFENAELLNTKQAYKDFLEKYPKSKQYELAQKRYKALHYLAVSPSDSWYKYKQLIEKNPTDAGASAAKDSILQIGIRYNDVQILRYCIERFDEARSKIALIKFYELFTDDGELQTLKLFFTFYKDDLFRQEKVKDVLHAELADSLFLEEPYNPGRYKLYKRYIAKAGDKELAYVALQRMIAKDIANKQWKNALDTVRAYQPYFKENPNKVRKLVGILEAKWDNTVKINSLGEGVNTSAGEYVPVISADEKTLYFCGIERTDSIGMEDIYVAHKTENGWGNVKIIKELSFPNTNDAPLSVSADGTKMLLFKSGKLNMTIKTKQGWNLPQPLPWIINSDRWQADAMISSDGKALIFASTRPGGYNLPVAVPYNGANNYASDIYVSILDENNEWGVPINLGSMINTKYCDRMPFLHPDMKTLYFSSDGHGGMGLLDVYKTTRLADSCWNCWSEPVNLGKEINTEKNDWGYKISTDGEKAYFAKGFGGEETNDLYYLNLPASMRPNYVATISGKLNNKAKQGVSAKIVWEDLETGQVVGTSESDPTDGSYFVVLPLGKMYGYYVVEDTYYPTANNIDLRKHETAETIDNNIDLVSIKEMIDEGTPVPINNLFFNFSESKLLPYSVPELERVAKIIKANKLKVEISGHTDIIGDVKKNQLLSEQRAEAVKQFLVDAGCDGSLLSTKGYGSSKPIAPNTSDEGRAKNRRVELRFIK